jgi:hypothetical protein
LARLRWRLSGIDATGVASSIAATAFHALPACGLYGGRNR